MQPLQKNLVYERMKENYRSKKIPEKKDGIVCKTEFRVWSQNCASAFSRLDPQGLSDGSGSDWRLH